MLSASDLSCGRRGQPLLQGVEFVLAPGEALQLEGANGSGKTTLLRTLAGLAPPLHGRVTWTGTDIRQCRDAYRQALLYMGHDNGLEPELTALENLRVLVELGGEGATPMQLRAALAAVGLEELWQQSAKALSQGQKRRVALARLWCTRKPLWLLDEPLAALDRHGVASLEARITAHLQHGGLLVFATHQPLLQQLSPQRLVMAAA